jgi:signal transduction histidine kinase
MSLLPRWLPRSLVGRVFALYTATLIAFVALALGLFYSYQFGVELEDAQLRADALAEVILPAVIDSAVIGDYDTIRRTLDHATAHSSFAWVGFIDLQGGVIRANGPGATELAPPRWLSEAMQRRLYDNNHAVSVGGRDYGVLRMTFDHERIAGRLWEQTRMALVLGLLSVVGGLALIWVPLVRWLGKLGQLQAYERAMAGDVAAPTLQAPDAMPTEFRETYKVLDRAVASLQQQRAQTEASLVSLRKVLEGLTQEGEPKGPTDATPDDLAAISILISRLVNRLQLRSEQLNAIFALSPDGFVSFDTQRRANYVSPAFTHLTGLPEGQLIGLGEREIEALLAGLCTGTAAWRSFEAMRAEARPGEALSRHTIEVARPAQRVLDVGLRDGGASAISQVLHLRDVTHETEVEQMKSEFLSTAAHELRTPMASIFGFAELMMHRTLSPEKQRDIIGTIHRQTQLMISIINELLDLARIEARRGKDFELETLDLSTLLPEIAGEFKPPDERLAPLLDCSAVASAPVLADRNKLRQAVGNVLSNAYKYSPGGGSVQGRVLRKLQSGHEMFGIEIVDQGIGMAPDKLARMGERFFRADTSGSIPGTGLGMSIVKEIIGLLGGHLEFTSEPQRGTTVVLWLRAAHAPAPATAKVAVA